MASTGNSLLHSVTALFFVCLSSTSTESKISSSTKEFISPCSFDSTPSDSTPVTTADCAAGTAVSVSSISPTILSRGCASVSAAGYGNSSGCGSGTPSTLFSLFVLFTLTTCASFTKIPETRNFSLTSGGM